VLVAVGQVLFVRLALAESLVRLALAESLVRLNFLEVPMGQQRQEECYL
jgi:hypothetical protein